MISYREPIDLDTIMVKIMRREYESMNDIWAAFEEFFICARYLYKTNERLMDSLNKL